MSNVFRLLQEAGGQTPRGHDHWWPVKVAQVMDGRFDAYYGTQIAEAEAFADVLGAVVGHWGSALKVGHADIHA